MLPTATCIKEECVSNLVCLIIAQPKILKSGPCRLEALYIHTYMNCSSQLLLMIFFLLKYVP